MANKAAGKGYESTDNYSNVIYEFYNIHNIHVMRESLQKLVEGVIYTCIRYKHYLVSICSFLLPCTNNLWIPQWGRELGMDEAHPFDIGGIYILC